METNLYKGYSNQPIWTLAIWLKTDESLNNYWSHKAKSLAENELTEELKVYFEDRNPLAKEFNNYSNLLINSL